MLSLRPMRASEYPAYFDHFIPDYAADVASTYGLPSDDALGRVKREIAADQPDGVHTDGHRLLCLVDPVGGIGTLWFKPDAARRSVFINDFEILPSHRGRGLGKQAMALLADALRREGFEQIELRPPPRNARTRRVYKAAGLQGPVVRFSRRPQAWRAPAGRPRGGCGTGHLRLAHPVPVPHCLVPSTVPDLPPMPAGEDFEMIAGPWKRASFWLTAILAILVLPVLPAKAAPLTFDVLFAAQNITGPAPVPTTTAGGLFRLTFDPTHDYAVPGDYLDSSISTTFLSVAVGSPVTFGYDLANDRLTIGGSAFGPATLTTTDVDFAVVVGNFTTSPALLSFVMTNGTNGNLWLSTNGIVVTQSVLSNVATTPIPGALPLLVTALGGLAAWKLGSRRRSGEAVA
ncbi:GNAT family N-acetyltransferase [Dongia sedimenti]|uniref:GNAT family N-acetyltransferase n=1 Tax=Dongia sedimenti TaxID=3064282 RepID=A0ABU0YKE8_9PROT|nr:GNAT family N-acetyltransferase [Rhodospirillaceae bacterium R-7]